MDRNAGEPLAALEASLPDDQSVDLDFGPTNSDPIFLTKSNLLSFLKKTPLRASCCITCNLFFPHRFFFRQKRKKAPSLSHHTPDQVYYFALDERLKKADSCSANEKALSDAQADLGIKAAHKKEGTTGTRVLFDQVT